MQTKVIALEIDPDAFCYLAWQLNGEAQKHEKEGNLKEAEKFYRQAVATYWRYNPIKRARAYMNNPMTLLEIFLKLRNDNQLGENGFGVEQARNEYLGEFSFRQRWS